MSSCEDETPDRGFNMMPVTLSPDELHLGMSQPRQTLTPKRDDHGVSSWCVNAEHVVILGHMVC